VNLAESRVVVTGASRGLGASLAEALAAKGARVVLVARSADAIAKLAADLGGESYPADLSDYEAIDPLVARIEADGPIDVLVNNAGLDLMGALIDVSAADIHQLLMVDLVAPVLFARAVIPGMLERDRGHILNFSSLAATNALPGMAAYSTAKAGLSHFTAALRADLRGTAVTTTLAEIGPIANEMGDNLRSYEPTRRALDRYRKLRLQVDVQPDDVVNALVRAIERNQRYLRMPLRNAPFPILAELPRQLNEWFTR
jgi:short-subunit dehydrogenase